MKAVTIRVVQVFIIILIILIFSLGVIDKTVKGFEEKSTEFLSALEPVRTYSFNIYDLITNDPNAFDVDVQNNFFGIGVAESDPIFCQKLRNCIEMNVKGGSLCLISYKVKPDTPFYPQDVYDTIRDRCPTIDVKEQLYGGTGRKICKFDSKAISTFNKIEEEDFSLLDYEPYIHNCYLPDNLGSNNVKNDFDSLNYLYSGRGTVAGYDFKNGGMVRIVVTNVSIKKDSLATCSYSLYVCGQNAIANSTDETTIEIFKRIQNMDSRDIYFNETVYWGGPPPPDVVDLGWFMALLIKAIFNLPNPEPYLPYNVYGYYPRTLEYDFKGSYQNKEALIDAIDAGMWEWNKINYYNGKKLKYYIDQFVDVNNLRLQFSYLPFSVVEDGSLDYFSGCWKDDFEDIDSTIELKQRVSINTDLPSFAFSESLRNNFVFNDFDIEKNIRMVLGVKKIFISDKKYYSIVDIIPGFWSMNEEKSLLGAINEKYGINMKPTAILVLDPVTFCSSTSTQPPECGNNVKEGSEQCDGSDLGGQTCEGLGYIGGTLYCSNYCTFATSNCILPPSVCGNDILELGEECDKTKLGGQTCEGLGYDTGTLGCIAAGQPNECKFDTSGCVNYVCGNDILESGEQCDTTKLGGQTCVSRGFKGGTLDCTASCTFEESGCTRYACENGLDDDGDTLWDLSDPGCESSKDDSEHDCPSYATEPTGTLCTNAGCYWYFGCQGRKVNKWKTDKCFDTVQTPSYACIEGYCKAGPGYCSPSIPPCTEWDPVACDCLSSDCH